MSIISTIAIIHIYHTSLTVPNMLTNPTKDPVYKHSTSPTNPTDNPTFDFQAWLDKHMAFSDPWVPTWVEEVKTKYGKEGVKFACTGYWYVSSLFLVFIMCLRSYYVCSGMGF